MHNMKKKQENKVSSHRFITFAGLSGFCVFIWTVVMLVTSGSDVIWQIQNDYIWIIVGPMAAVLIVSLLETGACQDLSFIFYSSICFFLSTLCGFWWPNFAPIRPQRPSKSGQFCCLSWNVVFFLLKMLLSSDQTSDNFIFSPVNYLTGLQIARPPAARGRFVFPHGTDRMTALFWW